MFLGSHPSQSTLANSIRSQLTLQATADSRERRRRRPTGRSESNHHLIHSVTICHGRAEKQKQKEEAETLLTAVPEPPLLPFVNVDALEDTSVADYKVAGHRVLSKSLPKALNRIAQEGSSAMDSSTPKPTQVEDQHTEDIEAGNAFSEGEEEEDEEEVQGEEELCQPCWAPRRVMKWHKNMVVHKIHETPPWHITALLALQSLAFVLTIAVSSWLLFVQQLGLQNHPETAARLLSSILLLNSLPTLCQIFSGIRLPLLSGPGLTAILYINVVSVSAAGPAGMADFARTMKFVGIAVGSLQLLCGLTGLSAVLSRHLLSPLSVLPAGFFYALHFLPTAEVLFRDKPVICAVHLAAILLFTLVMGVMRVPFCLPADSPAVRTRRTSVSTRAHPGPACYYRSYPLFRVLGQLMATLIALLLDYMLSDAVEIQSLATSNETLHIPSTRDLPWAYIPYPGQFAVAQDALQKQESGSSPAIEVEVLRALPLGLVCMVRSVGDYLATARILRGPPPPAHALNRGQCIDGLFSLFAGGLGLPPVSSQVGFTGFSGLANTGSRCVPMAVALVLLVGACLPRIVLLVTEPLLRFGGSTLGLYLALVLALSLSNLSFVSLLHARSQVVLGVALLLGRAFSIFGQHPMVIGCLCAVVLDAVLPLNTGDDNGRPDWLKDSTRFSATNPEHPPDPSQRVQRKHAESEVLAKSQVHMYVRGAERKDTSVYHLPYVSTEWMMRSPWARALPVLPSFTGYRAWRKLIASRKCCHKPKAGAKPGRKRSVSILEQSRLRSISEERIPPNPREQIL